MSLLKTPAERTARVRRATLFLAALLVVTASCNDGNLFSPNQTRHGVGLQIRPYFASLDGMSSMSVDINVVRLTIRQLPGNQIVLQQEYPVDPGASAWNLPVEVPPNNTFEVLIELINKVGTTETTVFSGKFQVKVTSGPQAPQTPAVYPGPPDNLGVTSVTVAPRDQSVLEGDQVQLTANVVGSGHPVVQWVSLNSAVATVDSTGKVTTRLPGTAVVTAIVGPKQDAVTFTVGPRATRVEVTPASSRLVSLGADATFSGKVLDKRNAEVPGLSLTWAVGDTTIVTRVSPGVFRARRNGSTNLTVSTTQAGATLTATATIDVQQEPVSVSVTPGSIAFDALGSTAAFTAAGKDANGHDVPSLGFSWTSNNTSVATVDASGKVTSVGNGSAKISATAGAASAFANVTVAQTPKTLVALPSTLRFTYLGQTIAVAASVKDANGNSMSAPLLWGSSAPTVVFVDANGQVSATRTGASMITVSAGALQANIPALVQQVAAQLRFDSSAVTLAVGQSFQVHATGTDAGGSTIPTPYLTWSSSNPAVATVSPTGLITGVAAGSAFVAGSSGITAGIVRVTVSGSQGQGRLAGRVMDGSSSLGISGATVTFAQGVSGGVTATTDANGNFTSPLLAVGNWNVTGSATGYTSSTFNGAAVSINTTNTLEPLLLVPTSTSTGSILGVVRNARTAAPIAGATVALRVGQNVTTGTPVATATADPYGNYTISNLPAQTYTVAAHATNYSDGYRTGVVVGATANYGQDVLLTPLGSSTDMYIVLTWGANPRDLDSHLIVPGYSSSYYSDVAYYNRGSLTSAPFAELDIDDTSGFGPETITLTQIMPGNYTYFVHHYSGSQSLATSSAKVEVYRGNTRVATFNVPNQAGIYWTVFSMNGTTITPINTVGYSVSSVSSRPMPFESALGVQRILNDIEAHPKSENAPKVEIR